MPTGPDAFSGSERFEAEMVPSLPSTPRIPDAVQPGTATAPRLVETTNTQGQSRWPP